MALLLAVLNPGVAPSGLFWTTPTTDESVSVDPAVYQVTGGGGGV